MATTHDTQQTGTAESKSLATLTILGRLRGTKFLWAFIALSLSFPTLAVIQAIGIRQELNGGDVGFDIQRRAGPSLIAAHDERWGDMRTDDELISLNGVSTVSTHFNSLKSTMPIGPLTVVLKRGDTTFTVVSEVVPFGLVKVLTAFSRWLTGVLLMLLGTGVFYLRPGAKLSWLFFLFLNLLGSAVMLSAAFAAPEVLASLVSIVLAGAPVVGFHFFANFPIELPMRRFARPIYVFTVLVLVVFNVSQLETFSDYFRGIANGVFRLTVVVLGMPLLAAVLSQLRQAKKLNDARLIDVTRQLMFASIVGLLAPLVGNTIIRMLGLDGGFAHQLTAVSVFIFGAMATTTLIRHNPLEIDRYSASVVGYIVTLGSLGAVFAVTMLTLPFVLKRVGLANSTEALIGLTAITVASIGPIYRKLRKSVDKWFSRSQADAMQTSEAVRRVADSVQNDNRDVSLKNIVDAAMVIGAELVALWQVDASGRAFHRVLWKNGRAEMAAVPRDGPHEKAVQSAGGLTKLSPGRLPTETQQALWNLDLVMSAPVRSHGVPVGFLGVGRRVSGFGYSNEDLAFLETLASQAGLALERGDVVKQIGQYRVEKRLAVGGMAEVFIAWQLGPGGFERKVALKRLLPELAEDPRSAAGLLDEARITARLQHPNIAQVYEVGVESEQHFIAMEFVDGPPLRVLIANQKKRGEHVPLPVALTVAHALLGALDHAHQLADAHGQQLHVVHRDVTPANVLVSLRGEPKLIDFGLVMASTRLYRTETGVARGTMPYMSPEQSVHGEIDLRADIYSAGATLYELFTNARAYPEGPTGKMPPPASEMNPALPKALDAVFATAFHLSPDKRFASAGLMWVAMNAAVAGLAEATASEVARWVAANQSPIDAKSPTNREDITRSVMLPSGAGTGTGTAR